MLVTVQVTKLPVIFALLGGWLKNNCRSTMCTCLKFTSKKMADELYLEYAVI